MAKFIVNGGKPIKGIHIVPGNKNAALPMLAASLLTEEPVTLRNIPDIQDVHTMMEIMDNLGVEINYSKANRTVKIQAKNIKKSTLNPELCRKIRASILFTSVICSRRKKVKLSPPGGDLIGRRPIDTHIEALDKFGIKLVDYSSLKFSAKKMVPAKIVLREASVTATCNAIMSAVLIPGESSIFNAACEPHVSALCSMLNQMGADISGIGTNSLRIRGVKSLHGTTFEIPPDYVDAYGFLVASAITGGEITLLNAPVKEMEIIRHFFEKLGIRWKADGNKIIFRYEEPLKIKDDLGMAIPKLEDGPWPAFPSDLMSTAIVAATQATGTILFFEKMFESRLYFVDRLIEMGARIILCDPHRAIISGPSKLHGITVSSPDIRAGMAILLAALCARGKTVIGNAQSIDRGYEDIDQKFRELGADIKRVND